MGTTRTILIADDDGVTREIFKVALEQEGYCTVTASNGNEALKAVKNWRPDLLVLNLIMPGLGGAAVFGALRTSKGKLKIPILVVTGNAEEQPIYEELGADGFLSKPVTPERLLGKVNSIIEKRYGEKKSPRPAPVPVQAADDSRKPHKKRFGKSKQRRILIVGDYKDFQEIVRKGFPKEHYRITVIENIKQLGDELRKAPYFAVVVRLAQVKEQPSSFAKRVLDASTNQDLKLVVFSDPYVKGLEKRNKKPVKAVQLEWCKEKNVFFYDYRIDGFHFPVFTKDMFHPVLE